MEQVIRDERCLTTEQVAQTVDAMKQMSQYDLIHLAYLAAVMAAGNAEAFVVGMVGDKLYIRPV